MALNLEKIQERLNRLNSKGRNNNSFWKVPEGESVIRIPPMPDGDPFVEHHLHYNVGKAVGFVCLRREYNKPCPVCALVNKLYKSDNAEDVVLAKKLTAKARFYSPVLVRGEEEKGVRWWSYAKTPYAKLLKWASNQEEYGDITDSKHGTDIELVNKKPPGGEFFVTDIELKRKESDFCKGMEEGKCKELLENIPELMIDKKTAEEIQVLLDEWLLGDEEETVESAEEGGEVEKFGVGKEKKSSPAKADKEMSEIDKKFAELTTEDDE
jgi:hypothetical protein